MNWKIEFFNETVQDETLTFPDKILAKMLHIFEMIQENGPNLGKPYTDAFGDGLFEIRAKGQEGIGRSFFCYASGTKIVILHSFVKKTQKMPQKEIDIALKRKKEIDNEK